MRGSCKQHLTKRQINPREYSDSSFEADPQQKALQFTMALVEPKALSVGDLDEQIERLKRCEHLKESEVKALCARAREILVDESNVQRVEAPVTVS